MILREAGLDDVEAVCAINASCRPDEPIDPEVERYQWSSEQPSQVVHRWMIEEDGEAVGFIHHFHPHWEAYPERISYCWMGMRPDRAALWPQALADLEERSRKEGTKRLAAEAREDEAAVLEALTARGFVLDHLSKVWELDLVAGRERILELAEQTRAAMAEQSIRCVPLSDLSEADRDRRLYEAWMASRADVPRSHPVMPISFEQYLVWERGPDRLPDRSWVALDGDRIVGMSFLRYPPVAGNVWTGFTGTIPSHRGRGIARAVKMESLAQAIELGVPLVRTDNDERNAPMLHINEKLGYRPIPAWMNYEKDL